MTNTYIAAYDVGTSGVKISLVDLECRVFATETAGYQLSVPAPGYAEQDPEDYWKAVVTVTKRVLSAKHLPPDRISGIVFCTQWKGIIPLDRRGKVLHYNIIWLDGRAGKQAAALNEALGTDEYCDKDYWAKLLWYREERPELYAETDCFLEVNSYLKWKATGRKCVDLTNHFILSKDPGQQAKYDAFLGAAGIDKSLFPEMVLSTEVIGGLSKAAAVEMGLNEGTRVFGGCGDIPAIAIGSGCSKRGNTHIYLGSSGWLGASVPLGSGSAPELVSPFRSKEDLEIYAVQSVCMTFDWAIEQFYHREKEELGGEIYDRINREIGEILPGSEGLLAAPWLHGERPPLSELAKAAFLNLSAVHDRRHFVRAVLESICYTMRWKLETLRQKSGAELKEIRVVGGGAKSDPWMQMMADVLQVPVEVPSGASHAGAIGTAYCAFVGMGLCRSFDEAREHITVAKRFEPCRDTREAYAKPYAAFLTLYSTLEPLFAMLSEEKGGTDH